MIKRVTMTGADRSVYPQSLSDLSGDFPFVEWGILQSRKSNDWRPRFPGPSWLTEMARMKEKNPEIKLSLHLCGEYVKEFLVGDFRVWEELPVNLFERVQLNTHGEPHEWKALPVAAFIDDHPNHEFIFQYDNVNTDLLEAVAKAGVKNISALYDLSHGAGILPKEYPRPLEFCKTGYAGGLGPQNLESEIKKIMEASHNHETWIDMETHVRSFKPIEIGHDDVFDLDKVQRCLEIAAMSTDWLRVQWRDKAK